MHIYIYLHNLNDDDDDDDDNDDCDDVIVHHVCTIHFRVQCITTMHMSNLLIKYSTEYAFIGFCCCDIIVVIIVADIISSTQKSFVRAIGNEIC